MEIDIKREHDMKVIQIIGDLDGNSAPHARKELIPHINQDSKLVFDMSRCEYISSAGLRVLLIIAKKLKTEGGKGVLAGLVDEVKDVMEITGFSHMLSSYATINQAIDSLQRGR